MRSTPVPNSFYSCLGALIALILITAAGCDSGEPQSAYEKAVEAQENLEQAREKAAELVSEAEGDAVETVQEAREQASEEIAAAKEEAQEIVRAAEDDLQAKMSALGNQPVTKSSSDTKPDTRVVVPEQDVQVKVITEPAAEE